MPADCTPHPRPVTEVRLLLFGPLSEVVGAPEVVLELPVGSCVADLVREAQGRFPGLLSQRFAVALNLRYADEQELVHRGDEVAFIPPVSGG